MPENTPQDKLKKAEKDIASNVTQQKPLVDTHLLDQWSNANLPLRGQHRKEILDRLRQNLKHRRTVDGIASRAATAIATPLTNAIQDQLSTRIQDQVSTTLKNMAQNRQGGNQ